MSQPFERLDRISEISAQGGSIDGLYRLMYHEEIWIKAYCKLSKNPGNLTKGTKNDTIDGTGLHTIEKLIGELKSGKFRFTPVRRTYIPKSDGGKRPLGILNFSDKLVQEVMRMILEAIYEPIFTRQSHGFRPELSCHTAIDSVRNYWSGTSWFIEGDIESYYNNIDHKILLQLLSKKIKDKRFIRQIHNLLKCGYLEQWKYEASYSGIPQGSGFSPVLANVYLHEFDLYMKERMQEFNRGKKRKPNPEYKRYESRLERARKKVRQGDSLHKNKTWENRDKLIKQIKSYKKQMFAIPASKDKDKNFLRLNYIRYADDFLIGLTGSKEECTKVKSDIAKFLKERLSLTLSNKKTKITNSEDQARFLNFNISTSDKKEGKIVSFKDKNGKSIKKRSTTRMILVTIPKDVFPKFFAKRGYGEYTKDVPKRRTNLICNSDLEIFMQMNAELRGVFNYYKIASFASPIFSRAEWFMKRCLCKTLANKHKKTATSVARKLKNSKRRYAMKVGDKVYKFVSARDFKGKLGKLLKKKNDASHNLDCIIPSKFYSGSTELEQRLLAKNCESCGKTQGDFHVHHTRRVKDLKDKKNKNWLDWIHITRQRRTVILCKKCHLEYHHGNFQNG